MMARASLFICACLITLGMIEAIKLRHTNFKECLQDGALITTMTSLSRNQCIKECAMRISCLSLNYRRLALVCELYSVTTGTFVASNTLSGACLHILKEDILDYQLPGSCQCSNGETCIPETSTCEFKECPNLDIPDTVVYGNMKTIGSRSAVKCNPDLLGHGSSNKPFIVQCQSNGSWNNIPTCPEYQGCFSDNSQRELLPHNGIFHDSMTLQMCFRHCQGYNYAGAQSNKECYCGNTLDQNRQRPESECSFTCGGDSSQICGGSWRGSVYKLV